MRLPSDFIAFARTEALDWNAEPVLQFVDIRAKTLSTAGFRQLMK